MTVWVDADSCPRNTRELLIRTAEKRNLSMIFVADRHLSLPEKPNITFRLVEKGPDQADGEIIGGALAGDLVITRDIPLAARLVRSGIAVIDDRGFVFSESNIGDRLSMRNLMYELREGGIQPERTKPPGPRELKAFADALDREITRLIKLEQLNSRREK
jgi:uncharacterized protein YaiI (UPF0178 family)